MDYSNKNINLSNCSNVIMDSNNNNFIYNGNDEMLEELIKRFKNITFDNKIKVFNYIKKYCK